MKKLKLLILALICLDSAFAQNLEECGINNQPYLNSDESAFLNEYYTEKDRIYFIGKKKLLFDFTDKKILFVTGSSGNTISNKESYFKSVKEYKEANSRISTQIVVFAEREKELSGGYDAIVTFWVKAYPNKKKLIRKIKEDSR